MLDRKYTSYENKYTVNCCYIDVGGYSFGYEIESKTEKVIYIHFQKEFLPDISQKEILERYIKYLELSIIDDWKYENEMLISEKAGLIARIIDRKDTCILTINTEEIVNKKTYYTDATSIYDTD